MRTINVIILLVIAFLYLNCGKKNENVPGNQNQGSQTLKEQTASTQYKNENETEVEGLPSIGKWMLDSSGMPSSWLGKKFEGKSIKEPVNIIIIDSISKSVAEAKQNLISAFNIAGYKNRWGHSSGYKGLIDTVFCSQLPEEYFHAFSTHPFEFNNNHGRIFGPYFKNGVYYFTGALSREKGMSHEYISFAEARDDFAASLDTKTSYKLIKKVNLDNKIDSESVTTGDHDGEAILISVSRR